MLCPPPGLANSTKSLVACLVVCFLCVSGRRVHDGDTIPGAIHTVVSTECARYFSFQTLALAHTHRAVGQPGALTRVMSCKPEELAEFSPEDMSAMDTHVTPSFSLNKANLDYYLLYNKPSGIMHWLAKVKPKEEWILIVDPDMMFRHPVLPEGLQEGWIGAAHYDYLVGSYNELADRHIPEVPKRSDTFGGNVGRRADEAGAYYMIRRKELEALAPLWKKYAEDVRNDPLAWNLTGDAYVQPGQRPWISEMYGWIYGAAKLGLKHRLDPAVQVYPSMDVRDTPKIIHYGLKHEVAGFQFDKHDHPDFDFARCPPWDLSRNRSKDADGGLFPHPPHPSKVSKQGNTDAVLYSLLLNIEFINTLNGALCERHRRRCPDSLELNRECGRVDAIATALRAEFSIYDRTVCRDEKPKECLEWKDRGECTANWMALRMACRRTCGGCFPRTRPDGASLSGMTDAARSPSEANDTIFGRIDGPESSTPVSVDREHRKESDSGVEDSIGPSQVQESSRENENQDMQLTEADFMLWVDCQRLKPAKRAKAQGCLKFEWISGSPVGDSRQELVHEASTLWLGLEFVCMSVAIAILFVSVRRDRRRQRSAIA